MSKGIKQHIRHSMPLELAEFLRINKCTEKYINNLYESKKQIALRLYRKKNRLYYDYLVSLICTTFYSVQFKYTRTSRSVPMILEKSFDYSETPEGVTYWLKLFYKAFNYIGLHR